jgi:outer membrane protein
MKRTIFLATIVFSLPGAAAAQDLKIGYINSQDILAVAPGAEEAKDQFDADMVTYRTEVEQLATELENLVQQYEQQQALLSPAAKQTRETDIRARQQAYQARVTAIDERAGLRQQELVQPVMDRINTAIEEIRAEGSYALIVDVSSGAVVAADPLLDLTQEVLARLQTNAAAAPTAGRN